MRVRRESDEMCSDSSAPPPLDSKCQDPDSICTDKSEREESWPCLPGSTVHTSPCLSSVCGFEGQSCARNTV